MAKKPQSLKALSKREVALGFITLAVMIFAYVKYWYLPKRAELRDVGQKIESLQTEIVRAQTRAVELQARMIASERMNSPETETQHYLEGTQRLGQVLAGIVNESAEVSTRSVTLDSSEVAGAFRRLSFTVEIEGSFPSIGRFVEKFESSPLLAEIESVDISRFHTDLEKCLAKLKIRSYLPVGSGP